MIKLQISGGAIIYSISQVQEIPSRNGGDPFRKRELILDDSWSDRDGVVHPNYVLVEFTGDKMGLLDNFQPGLEKSMQIDPCRRKKIDPLVKIRLTPKKSWRRGSI